MWNRAIFLPLPALLLLSNPVAAADKQKPFISPTSLLGKMGPGPTKELLSSEDPQERARGAERLCTHGAEGISELADRLTSTRMKDGNGDALFLLASAECLAASTTSPEAIRGLSEILQRQERRSPLALAPGQEAVVPATLSQQPIYHAESFFHFAEDIAASALARSRSTKANTAFLTLLLSPTTRSSALLRFAPALRQLPKLETEPRPEVALFLSEQINDLRWIPALRRAADQEDPATHASAIRALARYGDLGSEKRFRRALDLEPSRVVGASALLRLGDPKSEALGRDTLLQALASENPSLREQALRTNLPPDPAFAQALLALAISDLPLAIRRQAVDQLAHQPPPSSFAEIHRQLVEPVLQAMWILSASRIPFAGVPGTVSKAEEWFFASIKSEKGLVRRSAARAFLLWTARMKRDFPSALRRVRSLDWETKGSAGDSGPDASFRATLGDEEGNLAISPPPEASSNSLSTRDALLHLSLDHGTASLSALSRFASDANEADVPDLEGALRGADWIGRVSLFRGLAKNAKPLATRLLASRLRREPHPTLRGVLIRALLERPASHELARRWCEIEPLERLRIGACAGNMANTDAAPMLFRRPSATSTSAIYVDPDGQTHLLAFDDDGFAIHFGTPGGDLILGPSVR